MKPGDADIQVIGHSQFFEGFMVHKFTDPVHLWKNLRTAFASPFRKLKLPFNGKWVSVNKDTLYTLWKWLTQTYGAGHMTLELRINQKVFEATDNNLTKMDADLGARFFSKSMQRVLNQGVENLRGICFNTIHCFNT